MKQTDRTNYYNSTTRTADVTSIITQHLADHSMPLVVATAAVALYTNAS